MTNSRPITHNVNSQSAHTASIFFSFLAGEENFTCTQNNLSKGGRYLWNITAFEKHNNAGEVSLYVLFNFFVSFQGNFGVW